MKWNFETVEKPDWFKETEAQPVNNNKPKRYVTFRELIFWICVSNIARDFIEILAAIKFYGK